MVAFNIKTGIKLFENDIDPTATYPMLIKQYIMVYL